MFSSLHMRKNSDYSSNNQLLASENDLFGCYFSQKCDFYPFLGDFRQFCLIVRPPVEQLNLNHWVKNRSDGLFLHLTCVVNAHIRQVCSAFRHCVTHKNSLIASDFEYMLGLRFFVSTGCRSKNNGKRKSESGKLFFQIQLRAFCRDFTLLGEVADNLNNVLLVAYDVSNNLFYCHWLGGKER